MNYEKLEKHIIGIVEKICRIYADKEVFTRVYEKYKTSFAKGIDDVFAGVDMCADYHDY